MNIDFIQWAKEIELTQWIQAGAFLCGAIMIPWQMKQERDLQDRNNKLDLYKPLIGYLPNIFSTNQAQFDRFVNEFLGRYQEMLITIPEDKIIKQVLNLIDKRVNQEATTEELLNLCKKLVLDIRKSFYPKSKLTIEDNVVRFLVNNNNLKEGMRDGDVENIRTQYIKLLESLEPIIRAKSLQDIDVKAIHEKIYKQQLTLFLSGSDATIGSIKQLTSNICKILDDISLQEDDKKRLFLELQKNYNEILVAMRRDLRSDSLLSL